VKKYSPNAIDMLVKARRQSFTLIPSIFSSLKTRNEHQHSHRTRNVQLTQLLSTVIDAPRNRSAALNSTPRYNFTCIAFNLNRFLTQNCRSSHQIGGGEPGDAGSSSLFLKYAGGGVLALKALSYVGGASTSPSSTALLICRGRRAEYGDSPPSFL